MRKVHLQRLVNIAILILIISSILINFLYSTSLFKTLKDPRVIIKGLDYKQEKQVNIIMLFSFLFIYIFLFFDLKIARFLQMLTFFFLSVTNFVAYPREITVALGILAGVGLGFRYGFFKTATPIILIILTYIAISFFQYYNDLELIIRNVSYIMLIAVSFHIAYLIIGEIKELPD